MKDGVTPKIHRSLDCKRNEPFYWDRRLCCFGKNSVMRPFGQAVSHHRVESNTHSSPVFRVVNHVADCARVKPLATFRNTAAVRCRSVWLQSNRREHPAARIVTICRTSGLDSDNESHGRHAEKHVHWLSGSKKGISHDLGRTSIWKWSRRAPSEPAVALCGVDNASTSPFSPSSILGRSSSR